MTTTIIRYSPAGPGETLDSMDAPNFSPTLPDSPLHDSERLSSMDDSSPEMMASGRFSPPPWRAHGTGPIPTGWFKNVPSISPNLSERRSKSISPEYHDATEDGYSDDEDGAYHHDSDGEGAYELHTASRIPLPVSPEHGRSPSPTPDPIDLSTPAARRRHPFVDKIPSLLPHVLEGDESATPTQKNYIRFTTSIDVIQRTEPIEAALAWLRSLWQHATQSRTRFSAYLVAGCLLAWFIAFVTRAPRVTSMPDLVDIAKMADSFKPALYYSESSTAQVDALQDTGYAVWDLSESVRHSNMTGARSIAQQLDDLSTSINALTIELTHFFAHLGTDVDNILHTMEWAQRELEGVANESPSTLSTILTNAFSLLHKTGITTHGSEDHLLDVLGQTLAQRSKSTLERVFRDFLNTMEDAISNELTSSARLYAMFESIDGQFLNLRRSAVREEDQQERLESDFLSSMWSKIAGPNASQIRKFQKNQALLASIKDKTNDNKHMLSAHKQRLLMLKSSLAALRQRLVSPLLQPRNSTQTVAQQIRGLDDVYNSLKATRDNQKRKVMEITFDNTGRREEGGPRSIEAGR